MSEATTSLETEKVVLSTGEEASVPKAAIPEIKSIIINIREQQAHLKREDGLYLDGWVENHHLLGNAAMSLSTPAYLGRSDKDQRAKLNEVTGEIVKEKGDEIKPLLSVLGFPVKNG